MAKERRKRVQFVRELEENEQQVLKLLADGEDNGAIAEEMRITLVEVDRLLSSIQSKTGRHNRVSLAVWYTRDSLTKGGIV